MFAHFKGLSLVVFILQLVWFCREPGSPNVSFVQDVGWELMIFRKHSRICKRSNRLDWIIAQEQPVLHQIFLANLFLQADFRFCQLLQMLFASTTHQLVVSSKNLLFTKLFFPLIVPLRMDDSLARNSKISNQDFKALFLWLAVITWKVFPTTQWAGTAPHVLPA